MQIAGNCENANAFFQQIVTTNTAVILMSSKGNKKLF